MNIQEYQKQKTQRAALAPKYRSLCEKCIQPDFSCYCKNVKPFSCPINFVILIHPIEAKRRIATGRMSHLCLADSFLIKGQNFTSNPLVDSLIADPDYHSVILYPGLNSVNLSNIPEANRNDYFDPEKKLRIFVIDGTWATAGRMVRQSENINKLPRISFTPTHPSNFKVRKQPEAHCFSTIEAIHHTIELLGNSQGLDLEHRSHDHLLDVFNAMVDKQLGFLKEVKMNLREANYRRETQKNWDL